MEAFNVLDFQSKRTLLYAHGVLVSTIIYFHYRINLYSFDRYFIEEFFDMEVKGVTRITAAEDRDLRKYIQEIGLREINAILEKNV
jgi:hypothetical protein